MRLKIDQKTANTINKMAAINGVAPERVVARAIEDQNAKFEALKAQIDRAYERGGSNTSEEVAASIRAALD